jgi:dihydroxyacetone kinase-like predicted kinase
LIAAVALAPELGVERNALALTDALARVRIGAVAPAARDDRAGRFREGDAVGFVGEEVVSWGDPAQALTAVLVRLAAGAELVSVLAGRDAPMSPAAVEAALDGHLGDAELELRRGGQEAYWWLLAAE